jgi:hypothetical protein
MTTDNPLAEEYEELKKRLISIGVAIPGTIHALYALCGSENCECVKNNSKRHGPYYRWHYRDSNRQVTIGLDKKVVGLFETWIKNRKEIDRIVGRMLDIGAAFAKEKCADKNLPRKKSKNIHPSTRGK